MASDRAENRLVVVLSCLLAIVGVMLMRISLNMDLRVWAVAYLSMGLTASIRRTSHGTSFTTLSAIRGFMCLVIGLFVTDKLGYHSVSLASARMLPEELLTALHWIQ
jgi:hypothetical protein